MIKARMAELVDATALRAVPNRGVGSSPAAGTNDNEPTWHITVSEVGCDEQGNSHFHTVEVRAATERKARIEAACLIMSEAAFPVNGDGIVFEIKLQEIDYAK